MKRWHQFHDGHSLAFGFGTEIQARRRLAQINGQRVANHYALTTLDEGEEPRAGSLVVDLDTGEALQPHPGPRLSHTPR